MWIGKNGKARASDFDSVNGPRFAARLDAKREDTQYSNCRLTRKCPTMSCPKSFVPVSKRGGLSAV